jgi:hypothetical protein
LPAESNTRKSLTSEKLADVVIDSVRSSNDLPSTKSKKGNKEQPNESSLLIEDNLKASSEEFVVTGATKNLSRPAAQLPIPKEDKRSLEPLQRVLTPTPGSGEQKMTQDQTSNQQTSQSETQPRKMVLRAF